MDQLGGFTDQPNQSSRLVLADGSIATLVLTYVQNQAGWFYNISWGTWAANGRRLVTGPNLLRQFKEIIPFGLAVYTDENAEPTGIEDLADGTSVLYLLNQTDVAGLEETVFDRQ